MLLVVAILLLPCVYGLVISPTVDELLRKADREALDLLFSTFAIEGRVLAEMEALLRYDAFDFERHYNHKEPLPRAEALAAFKHEQALQLGIFGVQKLIKDDFLAREIFIELDDCPHQGPLMIELGTFFSDMSIWRAATLCAVKTQMKSIESIRWLSNFWSRCSRDDFEATFTAIESIKIAPKVLAQAKQIHKLRSTTEWSTFDSTENFVKERYLQPCRAAHARKLGLPDSNPNSETTKICDLVMTLTQQPIDTGETAAMMPGLRAMAKYSTDQTFWDVYAEALIKS